MNDKVYSMLGLAQKSGNLVSGDDICEVTIRSGKCLLVIITKDASERTKHKFVTISKTKNVNIYEYGFKEELGSAIGKGVRSVVGIKDSNFAKKVEELLIESSKKNGGEPID